MKNYLAYQSTEYDCVPTSFINVLRYLFEREDIPPEVIQRIYLYSLDSFNRKGEQGKKGTTYRAVTHICDWINEYSEYHNFKLQCDYFSGEDVSIKFRDEIISCIMNNGVILIRIYLEQNTYHYVLLTDIDDEFVYVFDPYLRKRKFNESEIEIIFDKQDKYNRKIKRKYFELNEDSKYTMCKEEERECVVFYKKTIN